MSIQKVYPQGATTGITVPSGESIAIRSEGGPVSVYRVVGYPNIPDTRDLIGTVADGDETVFGSYASGATIEIEAGAGGALYAVAEDPKVGAAGFIVEQGDPNALNATGTVTSTMIQGGIVTTTAASAVTATLVTGALLDLDVDLDIGEAVRWSAINTGTAATFTVTASSAHTVVGDVAIENSTSGEFLTRKTAASTFVTYRIS